MRLFIIIASLVALVGGGWVITQALAGKSNTAPPENEGVYLYANTNWDGVFTHFTGDMADLSTTVVGTDSARSLRIIGPYEVALFADPGFGGTSATHTTSLLNLTASPVGINRVSSLRVRRLLTAAEADGLKIKSSLQFDKTSVAVGETITGSITYQNVGPAPVELRDIVIAGRPPGGSNLGGPWLDFRPGHGPITIPPGGEATLRASRTIEPTDPIGDWYSFSTYQDAAGDWHDASPHLNVTFTVTPAQAAQAAISVPSFAIYYVAPDGNDANPGTFEAPLASVQAGLDKLYPGDTLYLRAGSYAPPATLYLPRTGLPEVPIAVRAFPGETPIINGQWQLTTALELRHRAWITIDGLTIQQITGRNGYGIALDNATDITVDNVTARDVTDTGIFLGAEARRIQVLNCTVSGAATGVQIRGQEILVDHCLIHNNNRMIDDGLDCDNNPNSGGDHGGQAFAVNYTPGPVEIRNSEAWDNGAPSVCYTTDGAFVELFRSQNVNIHHNRSRNNVVTLESAGDTSGIRFWRNETWDEQFLAAHQANNLVVVNNTFWNGRQDIPVMVWIGAGNNFGNGSTDGFVFQNNIVAAPRFFFQVLQAWSPAATVDNNLYYPVVASARFGILSKRGVTSLANWQTESSRDANSFVADPRLVDPAQGNLSLFADSPAINRGVIVAGITDGHLGTAPDIGRWERD